MSVEKKSRHSFFILKIKFKNYKRSSHHENLRNQNQQKKNKKEVLP